MSKVLVSEHGIVCRLPGERFSYFGWPTIARLDDGMLIVASSGLRSEHVCPWGKTVLNTSSDDGRTWSAPRVINDSPLDDRDAGIVNLGGRRVLVSWFTTANHSYAQEKWVREWLGDDEVDSWLPTLDAITPEISAQGLASWIMLSNDRGETWSAPIRAPVSSPHGPVLLRSGDLFYIGKSYMSGLSDMEVGAINTARSRDGGLTWERQGSVPIHPGTDFANYHEPHVVELPGGRLVAMIRVEDHKDHPLAPAGVVNFSVMQTESDDGGATWAPARPMGFHGSPPHLIRHSSGVLVMTYGYRQAAFGQRVAFSHDDGITWDHDWIIRDDGPDGDLGYPSTVELGDGSLLTVCYQKVADDRKCSLLWSRWRMGQGSGDRD